jgi:hypothetical protein
LVFSFYIFQLKRCMHFSSYPCESHVPPLMLSPQEYSVKSTNCAIFKNFRPLKFNYSPRHSVLKHPQSIFSLKVRSKLRYCVTN